MAFKWFVDAGHGGTDPGARGYGLVEKDLTLKIALKVNQIVLEEYEDVIVRLSRTGDTYPSLADRTNDANRWGANLITSIHINAGGGEGFESYIYNGSYASKSATEKIRSLIHNAIIKETGFIDRGKKESNFHMCRESTMTAILTENGFIDTASDANLLRSDSFLEKIARGHVKGVASAYGLKEKPKTSKLYRVQVGAFREKSNANELLKKLQKSGYPAYIKYE